MRYLYVQLFKPAHFAAVNLPAVLLHIFKVALRPLALTLFERHVVDGKFFVTNDVGRINYVHSRVFDVYGKGNILRHHQREPARRFVAGAAYRHSVAD